MMEPARPDPDVLLKAVQALEARAARARLKVFFGYAPGVGKTYAMLKAAAQACVDGRDVLVGCVETHGRAETSALLSALPPPLPKQARAHRGVVIDEFDLDAVLARRPALVLVDELAHSNAPGSRHAKRYQDVLELLDAGIDVWTTLNVQHVESVNDAVAQVTHVVVKETVPDDVLDRADEVVLVDLPPDELLARLEEGKVYVPAVAERAAAHFFSRGNLLALRELALRRTAERVDVDVRAFRSTHAVPGVWTAGQRLLCFVPPGPAGARVVRVARRMADEMDCSWHAVSVTSPLRPDDDGARAEVEEHLALAAQLGAEVVRLTAPRVADALLQHAREENVTVVVVAGVPDHGPLARARRAVFGSVVDDLVAAAVDVDVRVVAVPAVDGVVASPAAGAVRRRLTLRAALGSAGLVALATLVSFAVRAFGPVDVVMIFLAVIMVVAVRFGRGASLLASALSVAAFDYFFVEPTLTFSVADARFVVTFSMMFVVGALISVLTDRLRQQEELAVRRERRAQSQLLLSRDLAAATTVADVARVLKDAVRRTTQREVAVVVDVDGDVDGDDATARPQVDAVVRWVQRNARPAGRGTDTLPATPALCLPVAVDVDVYAVVVVGAVSDEAVVVDGDQRALVESFCQQAAVAARRLVLEETTQKAQLDAQTEEMRSTLLSAVSHDLRTPLATITGAATMLREQGERLPTDEREGLLTAIAEEGFHLERLVSSLLDMTRLESGAIRVKADWVPVDEVVGAAVARVEERLLGRPVHTRLPASLLLVRADPVLLQQVLVNLLENIARHTPPRTAVDVEVDRVGDAVEFRVLDRGPGMPKGVDVFAKFVRGQGARAGGAGLGLAIVKGLVAAHGGSVDAKDRDGGGSVVTVRLPWHAPPMTAAESAHPPRA